MDFGAYVKIDDVSKIAEENGINIPRLRGYRLMVNEEPLPTDEIKKIEEFAEKGVYENMCSGVPAFSVNPLYYAFGEYTDRIIAKYIDEHGNLRWNLVHGKKRKNAKFAVKKIKRQVRKQYETFNKYVGREDVLYVHARIGGGNWKLYCAEIQNQSWFLEKVDDFYDDTYCDIYAKIGKHKKDGE